MCGKWDSDKDAKLEALFNLLKEEHPNDKIIIFSQFADTVRYLETQLKAVVLIDLPVQPATHLILQDLHGSSVLLAIINRER